MSPVDYLLLRAGLDPNKSWHGAPLNMWVMFGGCVCLAAGGLAVAISMEK